MPHSEHDPGLLPPDLAEFLKTQRLACVTQATDKGTALIIKAPEREIASLRGRIPILLRHELYAHPVAPVIRMVLRMYDQPRSPLALETFINVEDPVQRSDYAAFRDQEAIPLLFYDQALRHRLSNRSATLLRASLPAFSPKPMLSLPLSQESGSALRKQRRR